MLSFVGKKFYIFWSILLLIFPLTINILWIFAALSSGGNRSKEVFISFFPALFQYIGFVGMLSLFFSVLALMFSMRLVREFDKYSIMGLVLFLMALYLSAFNLYNLI